MMDEKKLLKSGYVILFIISIYQHYKGYGSYEMTVFLFIIVAIIIVKAQLEFNNEDNNK